MIGQHGGFSLPTFFLRTVPLPVAPCPQWQHQGSNFSDNELVKLCRAWLNTSQNNTKGTGQKSETFWASKADFFKKSGGKGTILSPY